MDSSRDLCIGMLEWGASPVRNTVQVDVSSAVGDCFFACVSVWLNVFFGRTLWDPQRLRLSLAAALAWPEAFSVLERVRDDLCHYCGMSTEATLEEMQALVMKSSTWADHPIMSVAALFCSRITNTRTGFVVVQLSQNENETSVFTVSPPSQEGQEGTDLENACVLLLTRQEHYLLLAEATSRKMIFSVGAQRWKRKKQNNKERRKKI